MLQNNLAVLLELSGDVAGAETVLRAALAEDPSLPQISKNLADILYRNGRYDEAREAYERAAKLAPDLGDDLYFKLGNIAYKQRDRDRARASWGRATELNPGHELAKANLEMLDFAPVTAIDDPSFVALTRQISRRAGLALDAYKDKCLRRRIAVRMRACGVHTYADYQALLERSPAEYERLRDALTINVTRFYRNAETWNLLRRQLVPALCKSGEGESARGAPAAPRARSRIRWRCSSPTTSSRSAAPTSSTGSRSTRPTSTEAASSGRGRPGTGSRRSRRCRPSSCDGVLRARRLTSGR